MPGFESDEDFEAFERILQEAINRTGTELLAFCVLSNHWHLIVKHLEGGELSRFVGSLTLTHTQHWQAHRRNAGTGHDYQGRFKSFRVLEDDEYLLTVCRTVERIEKCETAPEIKSRDGLLWQKKQEGRVVADGYRNDDGISGGRL